MKKAWFILLFVIFILFAGCRSAQPEVGSTPSATRPGSGNALTVVTREPAASPTASGEALSEVTGQPETAVSPTIESADGVNGVTAVASEPPSASPSPIKPTRQPVQPPVQETATGQQEPTRTVATTRANPTPTTVNLATAMATAAATAIATTLPLSETVPTVLPATPQNLITATPGIVNYDMGHIPAESLVSGLLESNEIHSYLFSVEAASPISVTVIGMPDADVVVSIYNMADELISEQNNAPAGELEQLIGLRLPSPGDYWVQVHITNNIPSHYLLMLLTPESYTFRFQEMITIGDTVTASLDAGTDHFWFFAGNAGESVTVTGSPSDGGDLFLELYDTEAENASGFIDAGIAGTPETISDYVLPTTGVYGIRIGEYSFLALNYQLTLTRN